MESNYITVQLADLRANILAGTRLAFGGRVNSLDFRATLDQGIWLITLLVLLEFLLGYLGTEPPAELDQYGINFLAATYFAEFLILMLLARLAGATPQQTGGLFIAYLAAYPFILLVLHLVEMGIGEDGGDSWFPGMGAILFLLAWQLYIIVRLLRVQLMTPRVHALKIAILGVVLTVCTIWALPQSDLWYSNAEVDDPYRKLWELNVENVFYSQYPMMNQVIDRLSPQRPGVTDLYLVALGGYGYEKVFLNEVDYVRNLFNERFDTRDRSLVMANNADSLNRYPLANGHNLAYALQAVGELIDPDEDILFLFLTSHGSQDHQLSVDFGPIRMNDLAPEQIRTALDDAGIRWRVIVVSACYSGGFISALKDADTLVITASAKDSQSFGCGSQSEFTDFGDAYFRKALAERHDFIAAYDHAARLVADRERTEGRQPSKPQISIGDNIRPKLLELSTRFDGS